MIELTVSGDDAVIDRLRSLPDRLNARLAEAAQGLGEALRDRVQQNLSGAVLRRRSGRLAGSVALQVEATEEGIAVRLGIDSAAVPYAAYQEYGFRGTETVRASLRMIKQAFGRPIGERAVSVRSFTRSVDYPAHAFLRSALDETAPDIRLAVEEAVDATVAEP